MGYYTHYSLDFTIRDTAWIPSEVKSKIAKWFKETPAAGYALVADGDAFDEDFSYRTSGEGSKWYDHEEDFKKLSRMIEDVTFEVGGEGEESGDIWKKYFRNGKMQSCKAIITFEPFDPAKLV